jgi:S1-C subfamily serine protease
MDRRDFMALTGGGEVLPAISGRPGATVALQVTRGGSTRQVELTLRPYL